MKQAVNENSEHRGLIADLIEMACHLALLAQVDEKSIHSDCRFCD